MGKASRAKRERRETGSQVQVAAPARQLPIFWIVVGLLVCAGIATLVLTAPDKVDKAAAKAGREAPVFADVETGPSLPDFPGNDAKDSAVGRALPTLGGTSLEGHEIMYSAMDGPQVIVTVAHWCPHCQAEVPRIVEWAKAGGLPDGVQLRTVSTGVDEGQPNFPPAEWLAREHWTYPVFVDDEAGSAADALGLDGFPFIVFVDADGNVARRFSGEMEMTDFEQAAKDIAPKAA
jgi:thiol-disulfide isomerase/thioredoxin